MPDPTLHGNHDNCPACEMRREVQDASPIYRHAIPRNICGGTGHIALSAVEIVTRTCEEARRIYWPAFDQRISA